jgi:hypothetical protein
LCHSLCQPPANRAAFRPVIAGSLIGRVSVLRNVPRFGVRPSPGTQRSAKKMRFEPKSQS